jgi:tetratricopeptide (TPR) repeat protein
MNLPSPLAPQASSTDLALGLLVEELTANLQAGEPADVQAYVEEHPEHAERLRQLLPALRLLADLGRSALAGATGGISPTGLPQDLVGTLGDYRLLREVGRGGMGVVYEAEQISLGRRVALKVLPFASTLDARQLQRFKNEAHAAAQLHHTHIVPVYATGCERSVHFYAMQYVEGQTLAQVIADLRLQVADLKKPVRMQSGADSPTGPYAQQSAICDLKSATALTPPVAGLSTERSTNSPEFFRSVADLGIQAAEALEHAHQLGIIHRDIKPANLLIEHSPAAAIHSPFTIHHSPPRLWVTDFGLAHVQSQAGLTMTGDLVGTLRYMSPEQALAKRVPIDHRTDIYSLGVTLYELLTLEPAFGGQDRQELLRQIAFEEPKPPPRLNKAVPRELETIVGKAMEKNPADRYATAQDLADDLERFLKDEPIRARRPTLVQRARKWARRHRALVWSAAVVFLLAALMAGITGIWLAQKQAETAGAVAAVLKEAKDLQDKEKWPEALAAARRAEALLQLGGGSEALWQQVQELLRDLEMVRRLEEARLKHAGAGKRELFDRQGAHAAYAEAFRWYGLAVETIDPHEAAEAVRSRSIRLLLAAALDDWAYLQRLRGLQGWKQLLAVCRAADPDPWRNRLRNALERNDARALKKLAASAPGDELPPATAVLLARLANKTAAEPALAVLKKVRQRHPADFWVNTCMGRVLQGLEPPQLEEAIRYYTAALVIRPQSPGAHCNLGSALAEKGRLDEAIAEFREALRLKKDYVSGHNRLGMLLCGDKKDYDGAIASFREAIRLEPYHPQLHCNLGNALKYKGLLDEAITAYRHALRLKKDSVSAHNNLGLALYDKGQLAEAIAEYRKALRIKKDDPLAHYNLGLALANKGRLEEAIAEYREAIRIKKDFPEPHYGLGVTLWDKRQLDEAIAEYRKAIRLKKDYVSAHHNLGAALEDKGKLEEAIAEYREAIRIKKDDPNPHYNLGAALAKKGRLEEAIAEYREVIRLKKDFAQAHCNLGLILVRQGQFRQAVEELRLGDQLGSRNPRWPYPSAQWLRQAEQLAQLDDRLSAVLQSKAQPKDAAERIDFARLCQLHRKYYAASARFYAEAFTAQPALADDPARGHRYNAACAAALAGCGQGRDTADLDGKQRARLRRQALGWLRANLEAWGKLLAKDIEKSGPIVRQNMQHWQKDPDFAGVRGTEALARLPEPERSAWQKLWADVADTVARAQARPIPEKK